MSSFSDVLSYFDSVYVINLDSRPDRLESFNLEMIKLGLTAEEIESKITRFSAIDSTGRNGAEGCMLSHISIIKEAKSKGLKRILVFEDDATFVGSVDALVNSLSELETIRWDIFYLGYNSLYPLNRVTENTVSIKNTYTTHAIAYNSSIFDFTIHEFTGGNIGIFDVWLCDRVQHNFNCVGALPLQFSQKPGFSNIENREVNYSFILDRFKRNTQHL